MNLYEPTIDFPFSNMVLSTPSAMSESGTYFSKLLSSEGEPIHLQFPKSKTKNGVIICKRGCYTDLLYKHGSETAFTDWLEQLEEYCKVLIGDKKNVWFSQELDRHDIEKMLTSVSRPYKGGTMFLVRASLDKSKMSNTLKCQLYDQDENKIQSVDTITDAHDIIPLVNLEGIKFTSDSIDIIMKVTQIMIFNLDNRVVNDACLIKQNVALSDLPQVENTSLEECEISKHNDIKSYDNESQNQNNVVEHDISNKNITLGEISELPDNLNETVDLNEVNISSLPEDEEVLLLKKPNDVYYDIYKSALIKAREMKKNALEAYLEAKQIKTKYMLEDLDEELDEDETLRQDFEQLI